MVRRVETAVACATNHPRCLLVMTGGPTAGRLSEATIMARLAVERGLSPRDIVLEEAAQSTGENASLTAPILERFGVTNILIGSKRSHLDVALARFRAYPVFRQAQPLLVVVTDEESVRQMEDYLRGHDNPEVRKRLDALRGGIHGID